MYHLALVLGLVLPGGVDELEVVAVVRVVSEHEVAVEAGEVAVKPWSRVSQVKCHLVSEIWVTFRTKILETHNPCCKLQP